MNLQIDFWQLVGMLAGTLAAIVSSVIALGRWLAAEYDRRQELRFTEFRSAAETSDKSTLDIMRRHVDQESRDRSTLANHAERLARLEEAVRRSPSHEDLKGVHTRLDGIATKTDTMQGQLPGLIDNVRLILNILKKD
ncbi:hypothetical protein [Propionivibrio sp.]|uniref:hypothetical protein n=1 Tax=Propionivibrio sp. TaxID=2212460 RepID=UPI003BF23D3B